MNYYIFVIDTEQYAGNVERQLTAWCTGVVGECEVGREYAEAFHRTYQDDTEVIEESDMAARIRGVFSLPDEYGCHRPTAMYPTPGWSNHDGEHRHDTQGQYPAYQSVGIFLETMPSPAVVALLQERALAYQPLSQFDSRIVITGFRLLYHREEDTLVAAYPLPDERR